MADSGERLCGLVSEFSGVFEGERSRVDIGGSGFVRCSRYGGWGGMYVILDGEPLEEVDCFKYLGSQVAVDGGCEMDVVCRINEGYCAWGALKSVLSNRELGLAASSTGMGYEKC